MKHIKELELSEADRLELEKGYHNGPTHNYRIRCKSILLKSSGKSASEIAEIFDVTVPTVYAWIKCRGLFLFYLPPYSPEPNLAETQWRILKGKWIRPADYNTKDSLFYCTNRALASVGNNLFVNYSYV